LILTVISKILTGRRFGVTAFGTQISTVITAINMVLGEWISM